MISGCIVSASLDGKGTGRKRFHIAIVSRSICDCNSLYDLMLMQGRLYLKKAIVVDVSQPTICDVVVDDPRQRVTGVAQRQLESIVPKANGARVRICLHSSALAS